MRLPPPVYLLFAAAAIWLLAGFAPLATTNAGWPVWVGTTLIATGVAADLAAAWQFRRHATTINPLAPEKTTAIVTEGLFQLSRNPMYVGMLCILTGLVFMFRALSPLIVLPVFVWIVTRFQIVVEEQALLAKFGDEYRNYTLRVPRWF